MADPYAIGREDALRRMYEEDVEIYSSDEEDEYDNLIYRSGVESTRRCQALWASRYNKYYRTKIKEDGPIKMSNQYLISFLNSTIRKIRRYSSKGSVSYLVVKNAIGRLKGYAEHDLDYTFTKKDNMRLKSWFANKLDKNQVRKGSVFPRNRLTFALISRMVATHLSKALREGCISYDQLFSEILGISLLTGTACRNGDITCSTYYGGENKECYLKYKHISLYLDEPNGTTKSDCQPHDSDSENDDEAEWEDEEDDDEDEEDGSFEVETADVYKILKKNLRCRITLFFVKGSKLDGDDDDGTHTNTDKVRPFFVLKDHPHLCAITNLLIHCFRNDLIKGSPKTAQDLLNLLLKSPTREIEWQYPNFPVVCAVGESTKSEEPQKKKSKTNSKDVPKYRPNLVGRGRYLNLSHPAGHSFLLRTVKKMARNSGILGYVRTHSIRRGILRDSTFLTKEPVGYAGKRTASMAFHKPTTVAGGLTDHYVGHSNEPLASLIELERSNITADEMRLTDQPFVPRRIPDEEVKLKMAEIIQKENIDEDDSKALSRVRRRAIGAIHKYDLESFESTAQKLPIAPSKRPTNKKPVNKKDAKSRVPLKEHSSSSINTMNNNTVDLTMDSSESSGDDDQDDKFDEESDGVMLNNFFSNKKDMKMEDEKKELDDVVSVFLRCCETTSGVPTKFSDYIELGSRINIVLNDSFGKAWPHYDESKGNFESTIGPFCTIGGSRDKPTPFNVKCSYCDHTAKRVHEITNHQKVCAKNPNKEPKKAGREVACTVCNKGGFNEVSIKQHYKRQHKVYHCEKCGTDFNGEFAFKHAKHKKACP